MATYVFSDVHGHAAVLERMLNRLSFSQDDSFFCLGDMIDRGPDPVRVMRLVRSLPNCTVLLGNHEDMMLSYFDAPDDALAMASWAMNGGGTTVRGLYELDAAEMEEYVEWVRSLPLWAHTTVGERNYLLVHAGIRPHKATRTSPLDKEALVQFMNRQTRDDLLWIRDEFWTQPTGLLNAKGEGMVVIAGHTPTYFLNGMHVGFDGATTDDDGRMQMLQLGACEATGGVADKWDIDCGCASGTGAGQLCVVRLDDQALFFEPVLKGE